jgi:hypothetical protein
MVLLNFEDKDDLRFFQELKQSLMPTSSSSPIHVAKHSSLVFSNPNRSIDLSNLKNREGCFIKVGPSITFTKTKEIDIYTHKTIIYSRVRKNQYLGEDGRSRKKMGKQHWIGRFVRD